MKTKLFFTFLFTISGFVASAQCHYIPSTSVAIDTLSYTYSGGSFQSFGCAPIDPNRWFSGSGNSVTITFADPQSYPTFRVWGINSDDVASVSVNNISYPLTSSSATYNAKVVCGLSPGLDGVTFLNGNLVGVYTNDEGNYSYQDVQLTVANVTTLKVTGLSGAGWGFAGVSVNCALITGINQLNINSQHPLIYPNPFNSFATIQLKTTIKNAELNIYNLTGQKLKTINNLSGDKIEVHKDNLPSGLYYFNLIEDQKTIATEKLIISE